MTVQTSSSNQNGVSAMLRAVAMRLGLIAMLAHLGVAIFHHHDAFPGFSFVTSGVASGWSGASVSHDDQAPIDDGSDCAVCQILSMFGAVPAAILPLGIVAALLGLASFFRADCVARRPPLVVGCPRAPPVFL